MPDVKIGKTYVSAGNFSDLYVPEVTNPTGEEVIACISSDGTQTMGIKTKNVTPETVVRFITGEGESSLTGNAVYSTSNGRYMVGCYDNVTVETTFNQIEAPPLKSYFGSHEVEWKVFVRSSASTFNPSIETSVASGTLPAGAVTTTATARTVDLGVDVTVYIGQYVFVVFLSTTNADALGIGIWNFSESHPTKHGFLLGVGSTTWNQTLYVSSVGTYNNYQPSFKLSYKKASTTELSNRVSAAEETLATLETPEVVIALPNYMFVAQGRQINLYKNAITNIPDDLGYSITITPSSAYGADCGDYYQWNVGSTPVGTTVSLSVVVKNTFSQVVASKTVTLTVVSKTAGTGTTKVCCVGDSLTAHSQVIQELSTLFAADGGGNVEFIGTRYEISSAYKNEAIGGNSINSYTGTGGSSYDLTVSGVVVEPDFGSAYTSGGGNIVVIQSKNLTGGTGTIRFTGTDTGTGFVPGSSGTLTKLSGNGDSTISWTAVSSSVPRNPFYNTSSGLVDFIDYMTKNGFSGSIQIMCLRVGVNDLFGNAKTTTQIQSVHDKIKEFIDLFLSQTTGKVVLSLTPYSAVQSGAGPEHNTVVLAEYKKNIFALFKLLLTTFDVDGYSSRVVISPEVACTNRTLGYKPVSTKLFSRYDHTEIIPTQGIHPDEGYYEMADCEYGAIRKAIT